MEKWDNDLHSRCGCRWVPRLVGRNSLLHKCVSGFVAVEESSRDELVGRTGRLCLVAVNEPARFREGRMLCTLGALDVGTNLARVDGRM